MTLATSLAPHVKSCVMDSGRRETAQFLPCRYDPGSFACVECFFGMGLRSAARFDCWGPDDSACSYLRTACRRRSASQAVTSEVQYFHIAALLCVGFPCCLGVEDRPLAHWTNTRQQGDRLKPLTLRSFLSTEYLVGYCCWLRTTRFTPAGRDLGEALWSHWRQACAKAKTLLQFLLSESHSDGALTST